MLQAKRYATETIFGKACYFPTISNIIKSQNNCQGPTRRNQTGCSWFLIDIVQLLLVFIHLVITCQSCSSDLVFYFFDFIVSIVLPFFLDYFLV